MMGQGVFQTLLPLYAKELANLSATSIGTLLGMGGIVAVCISFPNGVLSDKYGRKFSLVPGLFLLAISAFLLSISHSYLGILVMVLLYGLAWGMSQSTSQVYAMDLAPTEGRGAFLGVWSLFQASGGFVAPLAVGALAQWWSFGGAFITTLMPIIAFYFFITVLNVFKILLLTNFTSVKELKIYHFLNFNFVLLIIIYY